MILSFGYTSPAFLAGEKTVTRRDWSLRTVAAYLKGESLDVATGRLIGGVIHQAWDKVPHAGGRKIGLIRLTHVPVCRPLSEMTEQDFADEGFEWFSQHPEVDLPAAAKAQLWYPRAGESWRVAFERWRLSGQCLYVVRFERVG
jgi:hypothetical protein